MRRVTHHAVFWLVLGILLLGLIGCGAATTNLQANPTRPVLPTNTPVDNTPIANTAVALSVQLGTAISGAGQSVSIVNPRTSFSATDTFAFVIHLRAPINASQIAVLVFDPLGNVAYNTMVNTQPTDMVLAATTPPLGQTLDPLGPHPAPAGIYQLAVFPSTNATLNYANNVTFTYNG